MLADVSDTDIFCGHLLQLVQDDELRKKLGSNSHQYVMQRFSYQRLVDDMSKLYYELLDKKSR